MTCSNEHYEHVCKPHFDNIMQMLDKIDESIRGNGKPGIQTRLDRIEQDKLCRSRIGWFVTGSIVTLASSVATAWIVGMLP